MKRILIVEDDAAIALGLEAALKDEHYDVLMANDGEAGFQKAKRENLDCIILDIMLPSKNGMDVCRDLRKEGNTTPILMLTSKKTETDKVLGLELGADDYVTKPFSVRELLARIRALLRRSTEIRKEIDDCSFGNVEIDFKRQEARKHGAPVALTTREFDILKYFVQHEGDVVTRDMLLDDVWGYETFPTTRTIDNYVLSLRKKIEDDPSLPKHLITIPTAGYKFIK